MTMKPNIRAGSVTSAVAGAAALTLVLAACSGDGGNTAAPDTPSGAIEWEYTDQTAAPSGEIDKISWGLYAEPWTLDYGYSYDYSDNQVLGNMCESLLRLNSDLSLSPGLAESWENPNPTTWVYKLREDVKFHDGTQMTADDAVASMTRIADPEYGSSWYGVIQNVESVEKTGEFEMTVTTSVPDSQFHQGLGGPAGVVESAATLEELGENYGNSTGGVNCTGPFMFDSWKSGEKITMKRFADYWDETLQPKAETFEFVIMNDATARVNALRAGEIDGSWLVPMDTLQRLEDEGSGDIYYGRSAVVANLIVSNLEGPLADLNVRKALLMAIDRQGILDAAYSGVGAPIDVFTTEPVWGSADPAAREAAFTDIESYDLDIEAAKQLIEEAGVAGEEITIATAPLGQDFAVISQATAAAAKAIGLEATIETVTPNAYSALFADESAREGVDLFYTLWNLSSPDPLEMYGLFRTGEFSNYGQWSNAEYDELVNSAIPIMDSEERSQITSEAQRLANAELPWLPLFEIPNVVYVGEKVTGLSPSINFLYYPWAATLGAR